MGRTNKTEKNSAVGLDSCRLAWISSGMASNVYIQKLNEKKAASVKANQRFRLRVKSPALVMKQAGRRAKAKKNDVRTIITISDRRCSGILCLLQCGNDQYGAYIFVLSVIVFLARDAHEYFS